MKDINQTDRVTFLTSAMKSYASVGAVTVSSHYVVKKVLTKIPMHARTVLEYGSGDGVLTRPLLKHLALESKLYAFEINKGFVKFLQKIEDSRLHIISGDVREVTEVVHRKQIKNVDYIVINVPLTFFSKTDRVKILTDAFSLLAKGGSIVVYQYSPLILPLLKKLPNAEIKIGLEMRNFPPYFIFTATKPA